MHTVCHNVQYKVPTPLGTYPTRYLTLRYPAKTELGQVPRGVGGYIKG